jgi:hypothetical protein
MSWTPFGKCEKIGKPDHRIRGMKLKKWMAVFLAAGCLFAGCGKDGPEPETRQESSSLPAASETEVQTEPPSSFSVIDAQGDGEEIDPGDYTGEITVNVPEASGTRVYEGNGVTIDASHTEDGYIMVKCEASPSRLKVRVILDGETYSYDLNQDGLYEVYPLQMGNGTYEVKVYQNIEGPQYTPLYTASLPVEMPDTDRVFVFPNQYVWYTNDKNAVKLSYALCEGLTEDAEKVQRIYDYIVEVISYDYAKAEDVEKGVLSGYIPDVDQVLSEKKGICFDYSALFASMLRAQEIPARLVIGNVQPENILHAWNQIYVNGKWVWMDATFGPDSRHSENDYTEDREY